MTPARRALAAAACALLLAGCGRAGGGRVASDIESARASMQAAFDAAEEVLAPARFILEPGDGESRVVCDRPGGGEGQSISYPVRFAQQDDEPDRLAGKVATRWRELGYEVTQSRRGAAILEVTATVADGGWVSFVAGTDPLARMSLTGESACVDKPGA